ncbi:protein-L-isoaspartate(D-aspartate) O-methyltransferase-like isoform X1 [Formica exsecta]|uniref:protein-L-isoaspartate(D-aspartate) O-methyltransferase-like isoform X1 n=1 Tax=Formica exsecta TaxID=72781 RepID=UPI001141AF79|nr:protein-L-isoaspartate(D-aspartate) O-methyltransferase-like isoform X1 [Formica exsecta]XP_029674565.1 protein-L-isoaspartate(D-aspartate) O-methyltransferase-like isoform X1 [Formica exsecta]XP_029674566.1 protein-L-isoaspartate(D-aspartate) O-methyltransferase-like isoform X1 [Formica exsecta]XP_029674567.1 protein-L-isoaspartate(D-aspartate) O-methyltransferase-like isoform X1 [Formica exsecta]XP_029674568.1 protein-L-isoaspartate(D-aspartate) O-methyltransferase-like isoform X1 [Formica
MAWHCNGTTNQEMVTKLKAIRDRLFTDAGILATDRAEAAMLTVDRAKYCHESDPYLDRPRRIGYNVTISAPHMHAYALSILSDQLFDGAKALDVGSGSGYLSACMAYMVGSNGRVIGIEHIPELIEISTRNVREDNPHFLKENRIKFIVGDGRLGHAADGPYNAIHVGAAADTLPQEVNLINQLAPGGRLICPVVAIEGFQRFQDLLQVDKNTDGTITKKKLMQVSYVPLTDPTTQLRN